MTFRSRRSARSRGVEACGRWLEELERRWSRFLPDSEVGRLNDAGGAAMRVSPQTAALVDRAVRAWRATSGRFDPTVLHAVCAAGYDRSFEDLPPGASGCRPGWASTREGSPRALPHRPPG